MALVYNNLCKINFAVFGSAYPNIFFENKYANITFLSVILLAYITFLSAALFFIATKINKFLAGYRFESSATADNLNFEIGLV